MKLRAQFSGAFAMLQKTNGSPASGVGSPRDGAEFFTAMQDVMGAAANAGPGLASHACGVPTIATWPVQHGENSGGAGAHAGLVAGASTPVASSLLLPSARPMPAEARAQSGTQAAGGQANESAELDRQLGQVVMNNQTPPEPASIPLPGLDRAASGTGHELQPAMAEDASPASVKSSGWTFSVPAKKSATGKDALRKTEEGARSAGPREALQHPAAKGMEETALLHPPKVPLNIIPTAYGGVALSMTVTGVVSGGQTPPMAPPQGASRAGSTSSRTSSVLPGALSGGAEPNAGVRTHGVVESPIGKTQPLLPERDSASGEIQGSGARQSQILHPGSGNALPQALHAAITVSEKENAANKSSDGARLTGSPIVLPAERHTAAQYGSYGSAQHESASFGSAPVSTTGTAGGEQARTEHSLEAGALRNSATGGIAIQVLSRMDTAPIPTSLIALRADARHLDVGVASSALGWVEIRASTSISGGVNAALHVQTDATARALGGQAREIADFARQHAVPLGQLSVDMGGGGGGSARRESAGRGTRATEQGGRETGPAAVSVQDPRPTYGNVGGVSLISLRA